jgi:demethylmenaquinone methyltransferase / 2-methoxy-6-polyprenyl-1,4-benzoquinol methylase
MTRASLDKQPAEVAAMFDRTAARYDLLNDLMTGGMDRRWRRAVVRAVAARTGERILDLAAGTGTSSVPFARSGALTVACDFSLGMLREGARRQAGVRDLCFTAGDALRLPFGDASFDAVTISFGIRNVSDTGAALAEMLRVTKPGGRLLVCEVSHPPNSVLRRLHELHLSVGLPMMAKVSSNPDSYHYLAESTAAWHGQEALARLMSQAGWESVRYRNLTFGVVALHHARRPADSS